MLKAVIIDDEIRSISILTEMLKTVENSIELVGTAMGVKAGIELIQKTDIDLLFLDIEMPDGTGFDLLDAIDEINFDIIFITAFNQYAIKAFRYAALDYLMKPINPNDLNEALSRVENFKNKEVSTRVDLLLENHKSENQFQKLAVATLEGIFYYKVNDIIRCEADGSYTTLYSSEKKPIVVSKSIKEYETILPDYFLRVHKSHLVNANYVIQFSKSENAHLILKDNSTVSVSRRRKSLIHDKLNEIISL